MNICPERQKLLDCNGDAVVVGGPGSGKTTIALKKAVVRIQAGLSPGQGVLFLSFSRNAVARILQVARLELSREGRVLLNVSTFPAFFWDLLKPFPRFENQGLHAVFVHLVDTLLEFRPSEETFVGEFTNVNKATDEKQELD
jgi:superfamily I DNA/RNA helicase